jgi:hypothetical protein
MATSYLIFAGRYVPSYRDREQALRRLAENACAQLEAPFPLGPFADRVTDCTKFKLEGRGVAVAPTTLWEDAVRYAHLLWVWELKRLTGETQYTSDSELMYRWMERQPVKARAQGWLSVVRRCGWHRSWRQWPRWGRLSRHASPRFWVYSVATQIFFQLPIVVRDGNQSEMDWNSLTSRLPLPDEAPSEPSESPWQRPARLTVLNYRRFLESTVA